MIERLEAQDSAETAALMHRLQTHVRANFSEAQFQHACRPNWFLILSEAPRASRRPNFFIVGAPKCGTTAMTTYLRDHPQIFMPLQKEPHYFAEDYPIFREVWTEKQYLHLFRSADSSHLAVGEASVWYLYSDHALPRIKAFAPDARIIVQVRNPVDPPTLTIPRRCVPSTKM